MDNKHIASNTYMAISLPTCSYKFWSIIDYRPNSDIGLLYKSRNRSMMEVMYSILGIVAIIGLCWLATWWQLRNNDSDIDIWRWRVKDPCTPIKPNM